MVQVWTAEKNPLFFSGQKKNILFPNNFHFPKFQKQQKQFNFSTVFGKVAEFFLYIISPMFVQAGYLYPFTTSKGHSLFEFNGEIVHG